MNIMIVAVTERTREIGIRLSVGATAHEVLLKFLVEVVTLSCIGGLVAAIAVFPVLTTFFTPIGLIRSYLSGSIFLALDAGIYWSAACSAIKSADFLECVAKALVFGVLTVAICGYQGYHARPQCDTSNARAVSAATTRAVVLVGITVLAADNAVTSFFV